MAGQLTNKQQAFIDAYLGKARFNAYRAAKLAGYKGNGKTLRSIASENLTKPNIRAEIDAHFEANVMGKSELASLLADQARVDISKYFVGDNGDFDLKQFKADGYGHLIKSVKPGKYGLIIEFIDKIKSQELIGRHLAMFIEKSEVIEINAGSLVDFEEWKKSQVNRENEAIETLEQFDEE